MTKKILSFTAAIAIAIGTGAALSKNVSANTVPAAAAIQQGTDAAFRDGLFLGERDAKQGRLHHVSAGRWSSTNDRAQFVAGYEAAYLLR